MWPEHGANRIGGFLATPELYVVGLSSVGFLQGWFFGALQLLIISFRKRLYYEVPIKVLRTDLYRSMSHEVIAGIGVA